MTQRDETKLKIVSAIDDDIIEKNAQKRYELWQTAGNRRPPSYYWIRWGAAAACLLAVLIGVFSFFALFTKEVPIYRGMTVSGSLPSTVASVEYFHAPIRLSASVPLAGTRPLNGTENVTTDTEAVSETEEDVLQPESAETLYYARPGEMIYITVHFDNPDQFEILSFTLNGEKKQVGMAGFEVGYDLQTVTVPMIVSADAAGVIEYTIDAIKYMDGTETKDVRMEGDDTVRVGVYTEKQPVATVADETIGFNDISFNTGIADEKMLITACNGTVYALLYEGKEIIAEQVLSVQGETLVSFHGLKTNASYRYVVVANYDPLDGEGKRELMLFEKQFSTKPILWFENVTTTQTDAVFSLVWDEAFANRQLTSLTLFHGADSTDLDVTATTLRGLLSNNEYKLLATYLNGGAKESVECIFKTKAKIAPTVTVTESEKTQTSLKFDVAVTDPDALCTVEKIELLHGTDAPIAAENTDIRAFAGLLSNNQYTIKVTYTYDLNDGEGVHTESVDVNIKTVEKTVPTVKVSETEKTQTSLAFDVAVTDPDVLCAVEKIELLHGTDAPIVAEDTDVRTFAGLLSNNQYTVKVTYAYDLNDGEGVHTKSVDVTIKTVAKTAPMVTVTEKEKTQTSIGFDIAVTDPDALCTVEKIELLHGTDAPIVAEDTDVRTFAGLLSNHQYTVKVTYTYDLNDGEGVQEKSELLNTFTLAREIVVEDIRIIGASTLLPGESAALVFDVVNPDSVDIAGFVVNGITVNVQKTSKGIYSGVYVPNSDGGKETLVCDSVNYCIFDTLIEQRVDFTSDAVLSIRGEIKIKEIKLDEPYFAEGTPVTGTIMFEGADVYELKSVKISNWHDNFVECVLTKVTENVYSFFIDDSDPHYNRVESISFVDADGITEVMTFDEDNRLSYLSYYVGPAIDSFIDVSTPEQLQNMTSYGAYRLVQDIDLSGFDWMPYEFQGYYFDGNGYTIYNMKIERNLTDKEDAFEAGLFSRCEGFLINVVLKNAEINITAKYAMNQYPGSGVGLLCAWSEAAFVDCFVEGDISIVIQDGRDYSDINEGWYQIMYVGGLVGGGDGSLKRCVYKGEMNIVVLEYAAPYESINYPPDPLGNVSAEDCIAYTNIDWSWWCKDYLGRETCELYPLQD